MSNETNEPSTSNTKASPKKGVSTAGSVAIVLGMLMLLGTLSGPMNSEGSLETFPLLFSLALIGGGAWGVFRSRK